jgi:hypothetical protein
MAGVDSQTLDNNRQWWHGSHQRHMLTGNLISSYLTKGFINHWQASRGALIGCTSVRLRK